MQCLKAGGSATEAVAVSIKLLEDNEITNAGLGSNLTIEGLVECDATIVDHFGRSGACGAVPSKSYQFSSGLKFCGKENPSNAATFLFQTSRTQSCLQSLFLTAA